MTGDVSAPGAAAAAVQAAVEAAPTSHLHPVGSYDVADHPVPTGREEVWRFTPIRRLADLLRGGPSGGHLTWKYDLPAGVTVTAIESGAARALDPPAPRDRLAALAVAHGQGAVLIDVAAETELAEPVVFRLTGELADQVVWGHVVLRVGRHATATVVFEHTGTARYASSVSVLVGDGARLDLVSLQLWDDDAIHTGQISSRVGRDARLRSFSASLGGDLVRLVETAEYAGPGGDVELTGLYFASGRPAPDASGPEQHLEHRLFIDH